VGISCPKRGESLVRSVAVSLTTAAFLLTRATGLGQAVAQTAEPPAAAFTAPAQPPVPKFHGLEGLIKLDVVVTDSTGKAVIGLGAHDFTVLDNGQPTGIASFSAYDGISAKPDPPVELILAIDLMNIPYYLGSHAKEEINTFLRRDGGHLAQPVVIYTLTDTGRLLIAGPSTDGNALAAELAKPKSPETSCSSQSTSTVGMGRPAINVNLTTQCLGLIGTFERQRLGRKLMIWVGPGSGVGSGDDWAVVQDLIHIGPRNDQQPLFNVIVWFSTLLREARIALFSTSVGYVRNQQHLTADSVEPVKSASNASFADLQRNVLAIQSGGGVPEPNLNLVSVIDRCLKDASAFYSLSFYPSHADHIDEFHDLKLQMSEPGLIARTNTGYYDQPFYTYQPNPNLRRVSVEELEQVLDSGARKGDGELADQLDGLQLTERLSMAKLANGLSHVRGKKAQAALVGLADASAFLRPPTAEIATDPSPSVTEQQRMFSMAGEYVNKTVMRFPDLIARRRMARYVEITKADMEIKEIEFEPLRLLDSSEGDVVYRHGQEVVNVDTERQRRRSQVSDLTTYGVFGPSLEIMRQIIAYPSLAAWSRWEQDASGRRAVFAYKVPMARSLYHISACCLPDGDGKLSLNAVAGYHGEITIDPASGAILSLSVEADLKGYLPILRSDVMVAYGPVEIGGKTYICPLRSVSLMTMRTVMTDRAWGDGFLTYGPYQTAMDDFAFDQYHMFRSTSRVLTENSSPPE
jgi:VWFA-related protein